MYAVDRKWRLARSSTVLINQNVRTIRRWNNVDDRLSCFGLVPRPSPRMLLMFSIAEFYAIWYTHCYLTRTVMVTIYFTGDMIELLHLINYTFVPFTVELRSVQFLLLNEYVIMLLTIPDRDWWRDRHFDINTTLMHSNRPGKLFINDTTMIHTNKG